MKRGRGRPPKHGKYYRFGLRYRPGLDPPELEELLERIRQAEGEERAEILRAALLGGAEQAKTAGSEGRIKSAIDDFFADVGFS